MKTSRNYINSQIQINNNRQYRACVNGIVFETHNNLVYYSNTGIPGTDWDGGFRYVTNKKQFVQYIYEIVNE